MHYSGNHPLKIHPALVLSGVFLISVALGLGACTEKETPDTRKADDQIVKIIRRPITTPPVPLVPKKTDAKNHEPDDSAQKPHKGPDEPNGSVQEAFTASDTSVQRSPHGTSGVIQAQGLYTVHKGDSLASIAEQAAVYGNPLKWTSLYRLNLEKFEGMKTSRDFQNQELPEGLRLKFVTPSEAQTNIKKWGNRVYAVNVLSAETSKKITPRAITLIQNGYNAYICTALVHDQEWLRLRAGFFKSRQAAAEAGDQIASLLKETKVWVVKISQTEINDYGEG